MRLFNSAYRRGLAWGLVAIGLWCWAGPLASSCRAQAREGAAVPRDIYFLAFDPFYAGRYRDALRGFQGAARGGIRSSQGPWVDAICYYSMVGECYYHLGDLEAAQQQHESALRLLLAHRGWMKRLRFPPGVQPARIAGGIPWGPSTRPSMPGQFPDTVLSQQGTDIDRVVRQGGIFSPPELYPVRVVEILRCAAVSLKRRRELLGPLGEHDSLTADLVRELSKRPVPGNHWANTLVDVHLAVAKATAGDQKGATDLLRQSLVVGGQLDHPLTGLALLELGKLMLEQQELEPAGRCFYDATFPAALFGQADVMEEAFALAARTYVRAGGTKMFPPLESAAGWSQANRWNRASASILLTAAENAALLDAAPQAERLLKQARRAMGRSDLANGQLGSRLQYTLALVAFQTGKDAAARSSLTASMNLQKRLSARWFQIRLADKLYQSQTVSPRVADLLFANVLREPTAQDWMTDPQQTLFVQAMDLRVPLEHWLEVAFERRQVESVMWVSEMIRRHKFYRELSLGGRLLALRWVLEGHPAALDETTRLQRQELLARFPQFAELTRRVDQMQQAWRQLPTPPETPEQLREHVRVAQQLAQVSQQQEDILAEIALRPEPATRLFPPLLTLDQVQSRLKPGQAVLSFALTSREAHALLITASKRYKQWALPGLARQRKVLVDLMRGIGNYDRNQVLNATLLADDKWKAAAAALFEPLAEGLTAEVLQETQELIIVPDGFFWYLPFEILQVPTARGRQALIELTGIRYAPTVSLAPIDPRPPVTRGVSAIVVGRLFGRDADPIVAAAARQLQQLRPKSVLLQPPLPAPSSVLAGGWDSLIVLDDLDDAGKAPLKWAPAGIDRGQAGSTLLEWLELPWEGPRQVILPGFPTAAENGLRSRAGGDEILVSICGLMASGTRSIVLSRWRSAGRTSMDLLREFLQELPDEAPAAAWQRAVMLARSTQLDPTAEPRLKGVTEGQLPQADHPFFWAGYLLIDSSPPPE